MAETGKPASSPANDRQKNPIKRSRTTAKPKKAVKSLGICSMNKKQIGDRVRAALALHKYELNRTVIKMQMDTAFFRAFFVDDKSLTRPLRVTPAEFDETTPIVVVEMGEQQAGELLGVTKIQGGNRYATTSLDAMCVVFRPEKQIASLWLSV